jgi:diacylglycerol kinase family enzyme
LPVLDGFLVVNPRSGTARPSAEELADEARRRGIGVHLLREGEDAGDVARAAGRAALGIAAGDGSLAAVAAAALERELPFVCVPFGTRNHFARDVGLDRDDPVAALDSFAGVERRIDVGRVGGRVFLNNVSLGLYSNLVHHRERRRRRREMLARLRAILISLRNPRPVRYTIDGTPVPARVVLVANNAYELDLLSLGERNRLDEGRLHLYAAHGILRSTWEERSAERFTIDVSSRLASCAVDGEPADLQAPLELEIEPRALRLLLPRAPGG